MWHAEFRSAQDYSPDRFRIRNAADAIRLMGPSFSNFPIETLRIMHLRTDGYFIALAEQSGGLDMIPLSLGNIVRDVCRFHTRRVLLAHNHPSGDPTPSNADRLATQRLAELLRLLEIELVDHLIFARDGVTSFRQLGLL